jgi:hypothetical protein
MGRIHAVGKLIFTYLACVEGSKASSTVAFDLTASQLLLLLHNPRLFPPTILHIVSPHSRNLFILQRIILAATFEKTPRSRPVRPSWRSTKRTSTRTSRLPKRDKKEPSKRAASVPVDVEPPSPTPCSVTSKREARIIAMYAPASHDYIRMSFLTVYRLAGWERRFS